jgi:hypothetical protein
MSVLYAWLVIVSQVHGFIIVTKKVANKVKHLYIKRLGLKTVKYTRILEEILFWLFERYDSKINWNVNKNILGSYMFHHRHDLNSNSIT